jgi:hypothetical protein
MPRKGGSPLVVPILRSGTVALLSGKWTWDLDTDGDRFRLSFRRPSEPGSEMVAYCRRAAVTAEVVAGHARDPLFRNWTDVNGRRWTMRLETPAPICMRAFSRVEVGREAIWIVFEEGKSRRFAWVPRCLALGELSSPEILRLLNHSEPLSTIERPSLGSIGSR